ncbi:MAG: GntR family transcriptional regulator [Beijerinckiaceae bacterium]
MSAFELPCVNKRALYLQVFDILAEKITSGELQEGAYLPNEFELSRGLGISIGTLRKAVELLADARMVVRQQGKGTLVSDRRWRRLSDKVDRIRFGEDAETADWLYTQLSYDMKPAGAEIANILRMDEQDFIHCIQALSECGSIARRISNIFIPVAEISNLAIPGAGFPTIARLAQENQIVIGTVKEKVSAIVASQSDAELLGVFAGTPVLRTVRVLCKDDGTPLEYSISLVATETGYYWSQMR